MGLGYSKPVVAKKVTETEEVKVNLSAKASSILNLLDNHSGVFKGTSGAINRGLVINYPQQEELLSLLYKIFHWGLCAEDSGVANLTKILKHPNLSELKRAVLRLEVYSLVEPDEIQANFEIVVDYFQINQLPSVLADLKQVGLLRGENSAEFRLLAAQHAKDFSSIFASLKKSGLFNVLNVTAVLYYSNPAQLAEAMFILGTQTDLLIQNEGQKNFRTLINHSSLGALTHALLNFSTFKELKQEELKQEQFDALIHPLKRENRYQFLSPMALEQQDEPTASSSQMTFE